jgi:hypothetical protein
MKIGSNSAGGVRPRPTPQDVGEGKEVQSPPETGVAGTGASPTPAESRSIEELRRVVGPVAKDADAATLDLVRGLLRAELGAGVAEEAGFEQMAATVADKIKEDPLLGDKLRKVLGDLARP